MRKAEKFDTERVEMTDRDIDSRREELAELMLAIKKAKEEKKKAIKLHGDLIKGHEKRISEIVKDLEDLKTEKLVDAKE